MTFTYWKMHLDCTTENAARKVFNRAMKQLDRSPFELVIKPYNKGGFMSIFQLPVSCDDSYAEQVVEAIHIGQKLGGSWLVSGDVHQDINAILSCNRGSISSIAGVDWVSWQLFQPIQENQ